MAEIRIRVKNANRIARLELRWVVNIPNEFGSGYWGNDVLMDAGRCLTDGESIESYRSSDIFKNYRSREEIMRHATTIDFANHTASDLHYQGFLDQLPTYLRPMGRISQNEFNEKRISNWGWAIRMSIREEFRNQGIKMEKQKK